MRQCLKSVSHVIQFRINDIFTKPSHKLAKVVIQN